MFYTIMNLYLMLIRMPFYVAISCRQLVTSSYSILSLCVSVSLFLSISCLFCVISLFKVVICIWLELFVCIYPNVYHKHTQTCFKSIYCWLRIIQATLRVVGVSAVSVAIDNLLASCGQNQIVINGMKFYLTNKQHITLKVIKNLAIRITVKEIHI